MLITNFDNKQLDKYKKALNMHKEQTGDKSLYIDRNAYGRNGAKLETLSALRCTELKMLDRFWRIFDSLEDL